MDITSPFFVVPVMVTIFLACILWATLSGKEEHHGKEDHPTH
jgi:hypothetical protein